MKATEFLRSCMISLSLNSILKSQNCNRNKIKLMNSRVNLLEQLRHLVTSIKEWSNLILLLNFRPHLCRNQQTRRSLSRPTESSKSLRHSKRLYFFQIKLISQKKCISKNLKRRSLKMKSKFSKIKQMFLRKNANKFKHKMMHGTFKIR